MTSSPLHTQIGGLRATLGLHQGRPGQSKPVLSARERKGLTEAKLGHGVVLAWNLPEPLLCQTKREVDSVKAREAGRPQPMEIGWLSFPIAFYSIQAFMERVPSRGMKRGSGSRPCSSAGEGSLSKGRHVAYCQELPPTQKDSTTQLLSPLKLFPPSLPPTHGNKIAVETDSLLLPAGRKEVNSCILSARNLPRCLIEFAWIFTTALLQLMLSNTAVDGGWVTRQALFYALPRGRLISSSPPPPQGLYC